MGPAYGYVSKAFGSRSFFTDEELGIPQHPETKRLDLAEADDNKFMLVTNGDDTARISVEDNGTVKYRESRIVRTSPQILLTPQGIDWKREDIASFADPELAPLFAYVHEHTHHGNYCLQRVPMYLAVGILSEALGKRGVEMNSLADANQIAAALDRTDLLNFYGLMTSLSTSEEITTKAIEAKIYELMGYGGSWDAYFEDFESFPDMRTAAQNAKQKTDDRDMGYFWDWQERLVSQLPFRMNFYGSIGNAVKVKRLPFPQSVIY